MALIEITKVEVGPRALTATVRLSPRAPRMTSNDLEGTTRVYNLMPHIIDHVCLGDAGETFRDVMGHTELAHLLEHMTVELLAQSNVAGDITSGRTRPVGDDGRTYEIELACPDDVLVAGALSSAVWMLEWAFSGGKGSEPDVSATVAGLVGLIESLPEPEPVVMPSLIDAAAVETGAGATAYETRPAEAVASPTAENPTPDNGFTVAQDSGSMLQLVSDDVTDDIVDAAATGRIDPASVTAPIHPDAESTARIVSVPEPVVAAAPEVPPAESPEARQAAADIVRGGNIPLPGMAAGPSVTGSLPLTQVVR